MFRLLPFALLLTVLAAGCVGPSRSTTTVPPPIFETYAKKPAQPRVQHRRRSTPTIASLAGKTIIVDAGHGGKDPGAPGVGPAVEKVVNLGISAKLATALRREGADVAMSRTGDRFISLDDRAALADRRKADMFVSIHADAAASPSAQGATIYIARGASRASRHTAQSVASALKRAGITCRGINRAGFRVLVGHSRPAMLVECGFLSNQQEARALADSAYQQRIANAIADGLVQALGKN